MLPLLPVLVHVSQWPEKGIKHRERRTKDMQAFGNQLMLNVTDEENEDKEKESDGEEMLTYRSLVLLKY